MALFNFWFQSTRPRGARRAFRRAPFGNALFQSTRPRGARHRDDQRQPAAGRVSIHAPAWGATRCRAPFRPGRLRFNPRARVGRDGQMTIRARATPFVSIHAPAWGATLSWSCCPPRRACFNPRARVGRDPALVSSSWLHRMFQSTRPRGARPYDLEFSAEGGSVSIHAPAWGATVSS